MKYIFLIYLFFGLLCYSHESSDHKADYSDSNFTKKNLGFIAGEIYNPKKVSKETFGAKRNRFGQWDLPIGHPMLSLMKEGYMIHPKKPNAMMPNPHTIAGRKLIASFEVKYAPSRGFKPKTNTSEDYEYEESGMASDFLKNLKEK